MGRKFNTIDLFAGCGGLTDGFLQEGNFNTLACVEWDKHPCETIANRLLNKWGHVNALAEVIRFDIQRTEELINGFDDEEYGQSQGLNKLIGKKTVDVIIGGPPCQAYSLAGRIRDENGMRDDYRNYLFESYIKIIKQYKPKFFIFENVIGMLSAAPDGTPIVEKISRAFNDANYAVIENFKDALYDVADFGVPQHRHRVIILGVNMSKFPVKKNGSGGYKAIIEDFYQKIMPNHRTAYATVNETIGDLPKLYPSPDVVKKDGKKYSHVPIQSDAIVKNHIPRYHSKRDQSVFRLLAEDIEKGENKYASTDSLKELYTKTTGKKSNIHKYYVLRRDEPSNTIPAHLYKDGMRHIHPDSQQARSITVREAARLQTFMDDFVFYGPMMSQYKMIGNAVPPKFAKIIAQSLSEIITKYQ